MTNILSSARPARAAIAAVLAFSATPLLAQEAAPPAIAPTVMPTIPPVAAPAPVPSAPAAATPMMAAPAPVVQAVPSVEARRAAAVAQSEAEAAKLPARTERAQAAPVSERTTAPVRTSASVAAEQPAAPAPLAATPASPAPVAVAPVATEPKPALSTPIVQSADSGIGDVLGWGLAGGALLLAGIAGSTAMRRRKAVLAADPAVVTPYAPAPVEPIAVPLMAEPAVISRPLAHAAPHGSLEDMVAAPPSAANPFLTRRNRLRRAEFLLRQSEHPVAASKAETGRVEHEDRSQMVYRFGAGQQQRTRWVPAKG